MSTSLKSFFQQYRSTASLNGLKRLSRDGRYLVAHCERNETLFFKTLMSDPARVVRSSTIPPSPTPACSSATSIAVRGMYLTKHVKGRMAEVLRNRPVKDIRFICVSTAGPGADNAGLQRPLQ